MSVMRGSIAPKKASPMEAFARGDSNTDALVSDLLLPFFAPELQRVSKKWPQEQQDRVREENALIAQEYGERPKDFGYITFRDRGQGCAMWSTETEEAPVDRLYLSFKPVAFGKRYQKAVLAYWKEKCPCVVTDDFVRKEEGYTLEFRLAEMDFPPNDSRKARALLSTVNELRRHTMRILFKEHMEAVFGSRSEKPGPAHMELHSPDEGVMGAVAADLHSVLFVFWFKTQGEMDYTLAKAILQALTHTKGPFPTMVFEESSKALPGEFGEDATCADLWGRGALMLSMRVTRDIVKRDKFNMDMLWKGLEGLHAYVDYHTKASTVELHSRMRRRIAGWELSIEKAQKPKEERKKEKKEKKEKA